MCSRDPSAPSQGPVLALGPDPGNHGAIKVSPRITPAGHVGSCGKSAGIDCSDPRSAITGGSEERVLPRPELQTSDTPALRGWICF
ncbi:hypothetical protein NQZ68_022172 [Dissostichus eleginoides]|nr:hypothetical protein NQZ68_022172 [Dissostichus eleginoides]